MFEYESKELELELRRVSTQVAQEAAAPSAAMDPASAAAVHVWMQQFGLPPQLHADPGALQLVQRAFSVLQQQLQQAAEQAESPSGPQAQAQPPDQPSTQEAPTQPAARDLGPRGPGAGAAGSGQGRQGSRSPRRASTGADMEDGK